MSSPGKLSEELVTGEVKERLENGIWRRRFYRELYEMLNDCDIINFIKINRQMGRSYGTDG